MLVLATLAGLALLGWVALWLHPARPWDFQPVDEADGPEGDDDAGAPWPAVCVLVPARNEAETLPDTLPRLLGQAYPGPLRVVLIDDRSDDGTAEVARGLAAAPEARAGLQVVEGTELPAGWVGKMWALEQGARAAFGASRGERAGAGTDPRRDGAADYVLLTDADIRHGEGSVERLVRESRRLGLGLNSRMARLRTRTFWERLLIPAFVFFFNLLYPMRWINRPDHPMAGAAGGCVLLSRAAYEAIGGFRCIRDEIIDDVNLGRAVKREGFPLRLSLSRDRVESYRGYDTLGGIWRMVRRTAFTELGYSWLRLAGCVAVMTLLFLLPLGGVVAGAIAVAATGPAAAPPAPLALLAASAVTLLLMARVYRPATRFYGLGPAYAFALPAIAALYVGMTVDSAVRHAAGLRSAWRGRAYAAGGSGAS